MLGRRPVAGPPAGRTAVCGRVLTAGGAFAPPAVAGRLFENRREGESSFKGESGLRRAANVVEVVSWVRRGRAGMALVGRVDAVALPPLPMLLMLLSALLVGRVQISAAPVVRGGSDASSMDRWAVGCDKNDACGVRALPRREAAVVILTALMPANPIVIVDGARIGGGAAGAVFGGGGWRSPCPRG